MSPSYIGLDYVVKADDRTLIKNIQSHVNVAKVHLESAAEIIPLIDNPALRKDAEALLDFVTEV